MSVFEFEDLCIDAVDPVLVRKFWAAGLGLKFRRQADHERRRVPLDGHDRSRRGRVLVRHRISVVVLGSTVHAARRAALRNLHRLHRNNTRLADLATGLWVVERRIHLAVDRGHGKPGQQVRRHAYD